MWNTDAVHVSARSDYAVRAVIELATIAPATATAQSLSDAQDIPHKFLNTILADLKRSGVVGSRRGSDGGYFLATAPEQLTVAEIMRSVEGPLADVRGQRPETIEYRGSAEPLQPVWIAARAALRSVLDHTTIAQLVAGEVGDVVRDLTSSPAAWE